MLNRITETEVQKFIELNTGSDLVKLALKPNPFPEIQYAEIIQQIAARAKAKTKLPTWFCAQNIIYPSKVSVEQTSSEATARYKASIIEGNLIDMTGGFGVDSYFFAKNAKTVVHCENDRALQQIAVHNFSILGAENIISYCGDSLAILLQSEMKFDWIYVDPSRRNDVKGKVFMLADCVPNVSELLTSYFKHSDNILIKTAPILDITAALGEFPNVRCIHIIAVENEVKELLFELRGGLTGSPLIKTVNLAHDNDQTFEFQLHDNSVAVLGAARTYLYEPNAAIMKSGGFDAIGIKFEVAKVHRHSHLYSSDKLIENFPGRIFKIEKNIAYQKSEMKANLQQQQANITVRNFPLTVEEIRKKWKIKDGGNDYCFFTTDFNDNKIVLICTKIKTD